MGPPARHTDRITVADVFLLPYKMITIEAFEFNSFANLYMGICFLFFL